MKFSVSKSALEDALSVVKQGLRQNSTLPILTGVYISAQDGMLTLQTSDLDTSIKHTCAAFVDDPGDTVLPASLLLEIVKNLPDVAITIELQGGTSLVTCEKSQFSLRCLNASEFPQFPDFDLEKSVELPCDVLRETVSKVYKAVSKDQTRPLLSSILLNVENNVVRLAATDSYRLAVCDTHIEVVGLDGVFEAVVNGNTFHSILSATPSDKILIGANETQLVFEFGNTTFVTRKTEGRYPNYKKLIPTSCGTTITLDTKEFASALNRVSVIAKNNPSVKLDIDAEDQSMKLSAFSNEYGESSEVISVQVEGASTVIALNYTYVKDCLVANKDTNQLTLELNDAMKPGVFKSYGAINYLYLLMPVRLPKRS